MDLVDILPDTERKMDNERRPPLLDFKLLDGADLNIAKVRLDLARGRHLNVKECLGHLLF